MKKLIGSYSQADQESFVLNMTQWKRSGFYVEIGAAYPMQMSNTYCLETDYDWHGLSIELDPIMHYNFTSVRRNPCYNVNALEVNYAQLFKENNAPRQIDYLQIDIDPNSANIDSLRLMTLDDYRFSTITFEHNLYLINDPAWSDALEVQEAAYELLTSYGYKRVIKDLKVVDSPFEDWYIDPTAIDEKIWGPIVSENISSSSLFE